MRKTMANREETYLLDDGTTEVRTFIDGKLVDIRRKPAGGTAPSHALRTPYLLDRAGA